MVVSILPSSCRRRVPSRVVSRYWTDGYLPDPGTACEVDAALSSSVTWTDVIVGALGDQSLPKRDYDVPNVLFPIRRWLI